MSASLEQLPLFCDLLTHVVLSLEGAVRLERARAYLFQLSRPSATLRQLYAEEPRWAHDALRFREQLTGLLTAVARGVR